MLSPSAARLVGASLALTLSLSAAYPGNITISRSLADTTAATCSSQPGIDFIGNDIANVKGSASDCCARCSDTTGCKAYTWSDFNGGTCWLKSAAGQFKSQSSTTSGVVYARKEADTDYVGNDIGSTPGANVDACLAKCKATSGCGAYTWSDWNSGTCWLKRVRGQVKSLRGVYSAEVGEEARDPSKWTIEAGKDYVGYDLASVRGASPTDCTAQCTSAIGCNAFTWSSWSNGTCWLKRARGSTLASEGVTSGVYSVTSTAPAPEQCEQTQGVDFAGNDIGNVAAASAGDCCTLCTKKAGCGAYTWTDWQGGWCWFKSAAGESKPSANAVSGRVKGSSSTPHVQYSIRSGAVPSRSVNLGGWLVSEYWMSMTSAQWKDVPNKEPTWDVEFNPTVNTAWGGEYITMKYWNDRGERAKGVAQFEEHRKTWITEDDIREIRDAGLNMVRVPVGFWIVDDIAGVQPTDISKVYAPGSLKYLDTLVNDWAVKYNIAVMLSLHSHQGSQNGNDHSAPQKMGQATWADSDANYQNSMRFATLLAARYKDSPAFLGLGLINEPTISFDKFWKVEQFYKDAYKAIRDAGNECVLAVAPHLWLQSQGTMRDFMRWPAYFNVWMEWHVYYKWGYEGKDEAFVMNAVRNFRNDHFTDWPGNYPFMGEWSLGTAGEALFKNRNALKGFADAQMQQYSEAHAGWAFWAWHHDDEKLPNTISGWSLRQLLREGIITVPK